TALAGAHGATQHVGIQTIDGGLDTNITELVALTFIDGEIDEIGVLGRIIFSDRIHLGIGIAAIGVIEADALTVDGQLLLIIGVVTQEPAENAGFFGEHRALEIASTDRIVAS